MSQPRSKSKRQDPPARDMKPYWVERGYRPEIAALQPRPNEDPKGEVAYQRAFAEAARSDPPRLPNPQKYPNSESAMAFLRQRDFEFTTARGSKRFGDDPPNDDQNSRKLRDPDRSPLLPAMKSDRDTSPGNKFMQIPPHLANAAPIPSLPSMPRTADWSPSSQLPATIPQQSFAASRLSVLEPYSGPSGPVNKLR